MCGREGAQRLLTELRLIVHLLEAGWPIYPVNPRTVDRRRSASGAKTDLIDAYLLAKTGRADFANLRRLTPDSEKVAEFKQLTRDQDTLIRTQTRLVNQLTACLKAYYPVALDMFSTLQQKSTLLFGVNPKDRFMHTFDDDGEPATEADQNLPDHTYCV